MAPLHKVLTPLGVRLVAPDQRGHGRTGNPGRTLSIAQLADDAEALMAYLGVRRPLLAGFSLGATVGVELARRGRLSGLAVLAGRIHTAPRGRKAFDPADIRRRSPLWVQQLEAKHVEIPWDELAVELGTMFEVTWPGFSPADLAAVACPTLVVQGDRDLMVPVEQGKELAGSVQQGQFHLVPSAGHPDLLYRQEALDAVREFFAAPHILSRSSK
jgi:pimeloyl-ACP methyl ester carboxylesterase